MANKLELTFEYGGKRFDDAAVGLQELAKDVAIPFEDLNPVVQRIFRDILDSVADAMKQRHNAQWSPGRVGPVGDTAGRLAKRSGNMLESIERSVQVRVAGSDTVLGTIGGNVQAATHERGATIRPTRKQFLTIPLPAALDSRGVPLRQRARDWPNTFVIKSKRGNLLIVRKAGPNIIPLYFLTKGPVTIPPRLGLQATLTKAAPVFVDRLFDEILRGLRSSINS